MLHLHAAVSVPQRSITIGSQLLKLYKVVLLLLLLLLNYELALSAADAVKILRHSVVSAWKRVMTAVFFFFSVPGCSLKAGGCAVLL